MSCRHPPLWFHYRLTEPVSLAGISCTPVGKPHSIAAPRPVVAVLTTASGLSTELLTHEEIDSSNLTHSTALGIVGVKGP